MRSKSASFIIRIKSAVLHALLQRCVERAYLLGVEDGRSGHPDPLRVRIDPDTMRKFE